MRDPYAVLGVAKTADEAAIKSAFRKLAKNFHPDRNQDNPAAAAKFNEANQAYEILGDKEKRAQFDRGEIDGEGKPKFQGYGGGGSPFGGGGGGGPFGGGGARSGGFDFRSGGTFGDSGLGDIFEQAFGTARRGAAKGPGGFSSARNASFKGEDINATLKVALEDIVSEAKVEAIFPTGKRLAIRLPEGVEDGQTIRLRGQGQPAPVEGGTPGDALVTISFAEHARFQVVERDLYLDQPLALADAVLGARLTVETLDGAVATRIAPWTNGGRVLRLRGKGLTKKDGSRGDLLVTLRLSLPSDPDPELIALFEGRSTPPV